MTNPLQTNDPRPQVTLPGNGIEISKTGEELGKLLAPQRTHFLFRNNVVRVNRDARGRIEMHHIKPVTLASDLEVVARFQRLNVKGDETPATCSEGKANEILHCERFRAELPRLEQITNCPAMVERDGAIHVISGYDEVSGIYALGEAPPEMPLEEAVELLEMVLDDFKFATEADRSRAIAAMISPALEAGRLLQGRIPIDLSEADQSQTGKGYRNKLTAAIYGEQPLVVNQQRGVGSLDNSFQKAVMGGRQFISLDNIRGGVDSQFMESFMTELVVTARAAYTPETAVECRGVTVMFTSNKAEMTKDLANRCSCVRILKQPDGYQFQTFPEGGILEHVQANPARFLAAVFAVIREWHQQGKPCTDETDHSFRGWCQPMDWIVQNLFEAAPLMDGHRDTQKRMSSPHTNWLRDVILQIADQGLLGVRLYANDIINVLDLAGTVEIPGAPAGTDLGDKEKMTVAQQQVGKRMKALFGQEVRLEVDGYVIEREGYVDPSANQRWTYRVTKRGEAAGDSDWGDDGWGYSSDDSSDGPFEKAAVSSNPSDPCDGSHFLEEKKSPALEQMLREHDIVAGITGPEGNSPEEEFEL